MIENTDDLKNVKLPILLIDETGTFNLVFESQKKIVKYQRISKIYQAILENYAEVSGDSGNYYSRIGVARLLAFYSPVGGSGKTTLSIATALSLVKSFPFMQRKVFKMDKGCVRLA